MLYPSRAGFGDLKFIGRRLVGIVFAFQPQGTSAPAAADISQPAEKVVSSITRAGVGDLTVTLTNDWPRPIGARIDVQMATPAGERAQMGVWTVGSGSGSSFKLELQSAAGAAADIAADDDNWVFVTLLFNLAVQS